MKALVIIIVAFCCFVQSLCILGFFNNDVKIIECSTVQAQVSAQKMPELKDLIRDFFGGQKKKNVSKDNRKIMVYPGGYPLGFTMECDGVVIVAIGKVVTEWGEVKPTEGKNIKVGDILYSINGEVIKSANHFNDLINPEANPGEEITAVIKRGGQEINEKFIPVKESATKTYRLGLWVRDNAAGVGTLTYVREDNFRFGALGHPVCDIDTGKIMPVSKGSVYKCNIVGYNKGLRGQPGELRGLFLRSGVKAGTLDNNNNYGVYGKMNEDYINKLGVEPIEVGFRDSAKTGKAKILCTIDGGVPEEYDIEIIKLSYQTKSSNKSMVIRVTDEELISKTGGIVQGMSGSPIIQNGKLIGAVTHVFVADPTKGFGVYIDWMIDN
ncbi:MAG: SpoIVB peptidase [Clostridia bacterium]|nr:SpoIVB peptidase [Clostridia bacterium]